MPRLHATHACEGGERVVENLLQLFPADLDSLHCVSVAREILKRWIMTRLTGDLVLRGNFRCDQILHRESLSDLSKYKDLKHAIQQQDKSPCNRRTCRIN